MVSVEFRVFAHTHVAVWQPGAHHRLGRHAPLPLLMIVFVDQHRQQPGRLRCGAHLIPPCGLRRAAGLVPLHLDAERERLVADQVAVVGSAVLFEVARLAEPEFVEQQLRDLALSSRSFCLPFTTGAVLLPDPLVPAPQDRRLDQFVR